MTPFVQIQTTLPSREAADEMGRRLVEGGHAACVQVLGPIRSTYRWQGAIELADEWLCLAKARADAFEAVAAGIGAIHPYEVPEIIATPIAFGSDGYLAWLAAETGV